MFLDPAHIAPRTDSIMSIFDPHLTKLLEQCTNDELDVLYTYLSTRTTSSLKRHPAVQRHHPDHSQYIDALIGEIRLFGGNTLTNRFKRSEVGEPYFQIVRRLLKELGQRSFVWDIKQMERRLVELTLDTDFDKFDRSKQRDLMDTFYDGKFFTQGLNNYTVLEKMLSREDTANPEFDKNKAKRVAMQEAGNFVKGKLASTALKFAARSLAGPIGWGLTAWKLLGPADRVLIPTIWYVSYLRHKYNEPE